MPLNDVPVPTRKPNFVEDTSDVANPLSLPSITGGDAVAGASGASARGDITGNFSIGGASATETLKSAAFPILFIGGLAFIAAVYLKAKK